jgi:hypothetical protein
MKDFICTNPFVPNEHDRRRAVLSKLKEQMGRYRLIPTRPKQAHSKPIITVSGKVDKDNNVSGSLQDDLMVALCMNLDVWGLLKSRTIKNFNYSEIFG